MRVSMILFLGSAMAAKSPHVVQWSTKTYGPDGPWAAVNVKIGSNDQSVDLLPGGSWMTNVFTSSVCTNNDANCGKAGFYNSSTSSSSFDIGETGDIRSTVFSKSVGAMPALTGSADWGFDTVVRRFRLRI